MAKARGSAIKRRIRKAGGYLIRRLGLLPGAVADGLGEDARLIGTALPHTVMVFFPDSPEDLYQLEQWYAPLQALDRVHRVVVVLQDSRTAKAVRRDCSLDAIVVARLATLDDLVARSQLKVALYVNQHPENFSALRFGSMVHASLMHGDSDKVVMVTRQVVGYDFALVAGQAAIDRMAAHVPFYDAARRCLTIGRPQLDKNPDRATGPRPGADTAHPVVLYAPTWEGAQISAGYGSVDTHGEELVRVLAEAGMTVIYRPHPLTGVGSAEYGAADRRIREYLAGQGGAHRVDSGVPVQRSFADADLMICDISAVAVDWLATERPLIITAPARPEAQVAATRLTMTAPSLAADEVSRAAELVLRQVREDPQRAERAALTEYYLGDVRPGEPTRRFVAAVEQMIAAGDAERARLAALR